jgi:hypothetical protein
MCQHYRMTPSLPKFGSNRDETIEHWKKFFRSKGLSTNKVAAGSAQSSKSKSGSPHAAESVVGDHDYE